MSKQGDKNDQNAPVEIVERQNLAERSVPYLALIVSIGAVALTVWQAKLSQTHNTLSVRPLLHTNITTDLKADRLGIELINAGLGPARIKKFQILLDGRPVQNWDTVSREAGSIFNNELPRWHYPALGDNLLREERKWLYFSDLDNIRVKHTFNDLILERVEIRVTYCSLYDECWEF